MTIADAAATRERPELFAVTTSRHFPQWLASTGAALAFTTYRAGKLFLLGVKPDGRLSVFERSFPRCMGLGVSGDGRSLLLASEFQIHRLDNVLAPGASAPDGSDALYVPHQSWITGDLDIHDIGFDTAGRPVFVNTLFNCLGTVSEGHSFKPLWQPPCISRLAAEDRCHMNGLAMADGVPAVVTAVSRSDVADGWRDRRVDGGVLVRVGDDAVLAEGLSMPHSPRLHAGAIWLLNSGTGEFGRVPLAGGHFEAVAFLPGFARGLAFVAGHAVIGLSLPRESRTFSGLPIDAALAARDSEPRCGLAVIDLASGDMVHWLRIEGVVRELYDVGVLPGVRQPAAIGFKTDEIKHLISVDA
ncbi:hypothetical protein IP88_07310 [alpha proteobacterium AAP81b]|nr:hypothetical protein IP88_07310 [alpha proteobacterium AAP81b]